MQRSSFMLILCLVMFIASPIQSQKHATHSMDPTSLPSPDWASNAVMYEVNIRQYTPEGTLKAFESHLPRLKKMGVDILWLMPIYPIGEVNRKGTLGSYYSIKDYFSINPKFGTMQDFDDLVQKAHDLGMKVILDWVANHTSFDHEWTQTHPEWYMRDSSGQIQVPSDPDGKLTDWTDVADLDFSNDEMQNAMIQSMSWWIKNHKIDGFRCDIASYVPVAFWHKAKSELDKIRPILMLGEVENTDYSQNAFHITYSWVLHHLMVKIAKGKASASEINQVVKQDQAEMPKGSYKINFIDNHDENSWQGSVKSRFGKGYKTFAVLTYMLPGMPLIYSGQEAKLDKSLKFFEKDQIDFGTFPDAGFYATLDQIKHDNPALKVGMHAGSYKAVANSTPAHVFSFVRSQGNNEIIIMANLSDHLLHTTFQLDPSFIGLYKNALGKDSFRPTKDKHVTLGPWDYKVFIKQ